MRYQFFLLVFCGFLLNVNAYGEEDNNFTNPPQDEQTEDENNVVGNSLWWHVTEEERAETTPLEDQQITNSEDNVAGKSLWWNITEEENTETKPLTNQQITSHENSVDEKPPLIEQAKEEDAGDENPALAKQVKKLKAANLIWEKSDEDFRESRQKGQESESELEEFAKYVAELKSKLIIACEMVRALGDDPRQHCKNCVKIKDEENSFELEDLSLPPEESTTDDQIAKFESQFDELTAEFDELLNDEQTKLNDKKNDVNAEWQEVHTNGSLNESDTQKINGAIDGDEKELKSVAGTTSRQHEAGAGPGEAKDGNLPPIAKRKTHDDDDDIVAKQLKEAAMAEKDPVLKEQIWKEYYKYKKSIR